MLNLMVELRRKTVHILCICGKKSVAQECYSFSLFCRDLQLEKYVDLYWRDYPSLIGGCIETCIIDQSKTPLSSLMSYQIRKPTRHV